MHKILLYICLLSCLSVALAKWMATERRKIFNLGPPKTGTTTLGEYLHCVGYDNVTHWHCGTPEKELRCGDCFADAISSHKRLDEACGPKTSFAEMDLVEKCVLPQVTHLQWLYNNYPGSKFVLIKRDVQSWLASTHDWGRMDLRMFRCLVQLKYIRLPSEYKLLAPIEISNVTFNEVGGEALLATWYKTHYARTRKFFNVIARDPQALFFSNLHESNLESRLRQFLELDRVSSESVRMGFNEGILSPEISSKCWVNSNKNGNATRTH